MTDLLALHERAAAETERLVQGIKADQLYDPTGCQAWDVQSLTGHLVAGNRIFAGVASGRSLDGVGEAVASDADAETYAETAAATRAAWAEPGALDREVQLGFGPVPGRTVLTMHLIETIVHGWDLARATGQLPSYDDEAVAAADGFARKMMPPDRPAGGAFGPATEAPEGASAVDRLAAFTGRAV